MYRQRKLIPIFRISQVEVEINAKRCLDFSTNNYLGLAGHPLLKQRSIEFIERYGVGSMASRLLSGNLDCFINIENKIAKLKGTEEALVLGSGYQANSSIMAALLDKDSLIILDKLCHNSLVQGARLCRAKILRFFHNDLEHLEGILKREASKYNKVLIVSESVFSMDGDLCDVENFSAIAKKYGALTYLDEAHATGILGKNGMGLGHKDIDIVMGTFSKAAGSYGSYVACSKSIKNILVQSCGGLIYSTALPPSVLGSIDAALDLIPTMDKERSYLRKIIKKVRDKIKAIPDDFDTPIIPIIVGEDIKALELQQTLMNKGFYIPAIRPPTVPEGKSRLRLSLSAAHTEEHIGKLLGAL